MLSVVTPKNKNMSSILLELLRHYNVSLGENSATNETKLRQKKVLFNTVRFIDDFNKIEFIFDELN